MSCGTAMELCLACGVLFNRDGGHRCPTPMERRGMNLAEDNAKLRSENAALIEQVDALTTRIAELEADRDILAGVLRGKDKEVKNLLSVLTDMVYQHCYEDKETGEYESGAISTDADAMEILAQHGRFEITNGWGRMIFGKFVEPPQKDGDE